MDTDAIIDNMNIPHAFHSNWRAPAVVKDDRRLRETLDILWAIIGGDSSKPPVPFGRNFVFCNQLLADSGIEALWASDNKSVPDWVYWCLSVNSLQPASAVLRKTPLIKGMPPFYLFEDAASLSSVSDAIQKVLERELDKAEENSFQASRTSGESGLQDAMEKLMSVLREDDFLRTCSNILRPMVDEAVEDRLALERKIKKQPSEEIRTYQLEPFALDEFLQRVEKAEGHRLAGVYVSKTFLGMIREYSVVLCIVKGSPLILPPMMRH